MGLITYENLEDGQKVTANVFNERFAQIVAQLNGNLDESNFANEGISKEKLKAEVYESMYPIGSQYVNFTNGTNPATLLGFGVWQAVAGRVIVGYDAGQTEFNAAEKTGGAKTHTLTTAEMPVHNHGVSDPTHNHWVNDPGHSHGINGRIEARTGGAGRTASDQNYNGTSTQAAATGIWLNAAYTGISQSFITADAPALHQQRVPINLKHDLYLHL